MAPSASIDAFRDVLRSSKHIIAVSGAGLSAASGIPTFRGAGGLWRKYEAMSLATPKAFKKNPSLVWQFYHYRREAALRADPNAAHKALAAFSVPAVRHQISPNSSFTLVTQNVDGLSPRANDTFGNALSKDNLSNEQPILIEMHGKLFDVACTSSVCGHVEFNVSSPICESLAGTEEILVAGSTNPRIPLKQLPRCSVCGSLARPGVVWFGEIPHELELIDKLVENADLCLVIGTSSTVYPAAGYAYQIQENGGKVAVFNLDHSEGDEDADFLFLGPCEEILPNALGIADKI